MKKTLLLIFLIITFSYYLIGTQKQIIWSNECEESPTMIKANSNGELASASSYSMGWINNYYYNTGYSIKKYSQTGSQLWSIFIGSNSWDFSLLDLSINDQGEVFLFIADNCQMFAGTNQILLNRGLVKLSCIGQLLWNQTMYDFANVSMSFVNDNIILVANATDASNIINPNDRPPYPPGFSDNPYYYAIIIILDTQGNVQSYRIIYSNYVCRYWSCYVEGNEVYITCYIVRSTQTPTPPGLIYFTSIVNGQPYVLCLSDAISSYCLAKLSINSQNWDWAFNTIYPYTSMTASDNVLYARNGTQMMFKIDATDGEQIAEENIPGESGGFIFKAIDGNINFINNITYGKIDTCLNLVESENFDFAILVNTHSFDIWGNMYIQYLYEGHLRLGKFGYQQPHIGNNITSYINYGHCYPNVDYTRQVVLTNTGNTPLTIDNIHFINTESQFACLNSTYPIIIETNQTDTLRIRYTPQTIGAISDTLFIENNSLNRPVLKISLIGTGVYVPPAIPQNLSIQQIGYNVTLNWEEVTQDILGHNMQPTGYLIFYNASEMNNDDNYYYLWETPNTTFTHYRVGQFSPRMFYRVYAWKDYGRGLRERLSAYNGTKQKLRFKDLGIE